MINPKNYFYESELLSVALSHTRNKHNGPFVGKVVLKPAQMELYVTNKKDHTIKLDRGLRIDVKYSVDPLDWGTPIKATLHFWIEKEGEK
ncbi:MAG: hypothetical protein GY941_19720 [Planctomycetes bacterium]|nr:hypothetical protein [Planctomycetota bacterium]